jgi:hypothetical protein
MPMLLVGSWGMSSKKFLLGFPLALQLEQTHSSIPLFREGAGLQSLTHQLFCIHVCFSHRYFPTTLPKFKGSGKKILCILSYIWKRFEGDAKLSKLVQKFCGYSPPLSVITCISICSQCLGRPGSQSVPNVVPSMSWNDCCLSGFFVTQPLCLQVLSGFVT